MSTKLLSAVITTHSLISNLLTAQQIVSLAEAPNLESFINLLNDSVYLKTMTKLDTTSILLERAFYRTYIQRILKIINVVPEKIAEFIQLYLMKIEILNLKRIIQGKFNDIPFSQIADSLLPVAPFDNIDFNSILNNDSLDEIISALKYTKFSIPTKTIELYHKCGEIWPLELALNHKYATLLLAAVNAFPKNVRNFIQKIIGVEIDTQNLLFALRERSSSQKMFNDYELKDLFPIQYSIRLNTILDAVEAEDIKYFIENLPLPYTNILSPIYEGNIMLILTYLRRHIYQVAKYGRLINDFGHNVIFAYVIFSEIEKDNLIGIAWGKSQALSAEEILKYVVIP